MAGCSGSGHGLGMAKVKDWNRRKAMKKRLGEAPPEERARLAQYAAADIERAMAARAAAMRKIGGA